MDSDVVEVTALDGHRIQVKTAGGQEGIFDLSPHLNHGAFRELQDEAYFQQVGIAYGAVTWPNGQDIAPQTLLAALQPLSAHA